MANYFAQCRSNYFLVKDFVAFEAWIKLFDGKLIMWRQEEGSKVAIASTFECGWPQTRRPLPSPHESSVSHASSSTASVSEETEDSNAEDCDFVQELATHLVPGHVAVLEEVGYEKLRYLIGQAIAVNASGKCVYVDLGEIYKRAARLGQHITKATY